MEELRCTGRTTRLADDYIQSLFKYGIIEVKDHHSNGTLFLFRIIQDRLSREHSRIKFEYSSRSKYSIEIKNFK